MADLSKIDTHVADALDRLLHQYKDKPRLESWVSLYVTLLQEVEDTGDSLCMLLDIVTQDGDRLDLIGGIVGVSRAGKNDAEYRIAIYAKIGQNTSNATIEAVIGVMKLLSQADGVFIIANYPATISIQLNVDPAGLDADGLLLVAQKIVAGGVKVGDISAFAGEEAFAFEGPTPGQGFGDEGDPLVGGRFAGILIGT